MRKVRKDGKDKISIQRLLLLIAAAVALLILLLTLFLTMCTKTALTFEVDGEVYVTVNATGEETLTLPEEPEKDGYVFDGWYWDKDIWEQPFTGDTPVTGNGKLYAKWKEAHEHSYGEWEVVTPATCTTEGQRKRVCSCGAEETEVIPTVTHNYETKFDNANHWDECSVCHEKINETAHTYGDWTEVTPATCTVAGEKKHLCSCGAEETEAIQKLDHSYEVKHNATTHWEECTVCQDKINETAHTYGDWTVVTPATCTAAGEQKHACTCGAEQTEAITKLEHTYVTKYDATNHWSECSVCQDKVNVTAHSFGTWEVVTPATCTAAGQMKHVCTVCPEEQTAAIPKLEHTYVTKYNATNHWQECSVCQEKVNITAHSFGAWEVVTHATCTAAGEKKHLCSCGAEETEAIQKLDHSYEVKHNATNHWQECSVCHEKINETAHSFGAWEVVTAATCTAEGQKKRVCTVCPEEQMAAITKLEHTYVTKHNATNHWEECTVCQDKVNITAHSYGDWTVVTAATCTAEGQKKHVCSCGAEETEAIPKLAHTYETKFDETNHWSECSVCQDKINITAHTFGDWTLVTPATCTAEGQKKHTCTCGAEETEAIPKLEHTYETKYNATNHWEECTVCQEKVNITAHTFGDWTVVTQATCTAEGLQKRVCSCGAEQSEAIPKLAHNYETKYNATNHWEECSVCQDKINETAHTFGEWEVVTAATCTVAGEQKHACSCGAEQTAAVPKLEHTYETKYNATNHWEECSVCQDKINITAHTFGDWTVVTPATCTAAGQKKHVCSCGAEETEAVPKLAHNYETKYDATNHWEECTVCQDKINETAHTFGDWTVVTPATCTAAGEQKHACTCGAEQTEAIPKLEHTYVTKHDATTHWEECTVCQETINVTAHNFGDWTVVTPATCTAEGQKKHTCACGAEETEAIQKLDHSYEVKHNTTNHWSECTVCHETVNVTAHSFGDWTVVTPATCTAEGEQKHVCTVCNAEVTAVTPVAAHSYATQYDDDNHWKECSVCGDVIDTGAHTYENEVCTVCGRVYGTVGLEYTRITNGYSVMGIGTADSKTKIEIPSKYEGEPVTAIEDNAFVSRGGITSVEIPNTVTSIGYDAFTETGIWNNTADNSVVYADKWAVGYKGTLSGALTLKADTVGIGDSAFSGCASLTRIVIPNSVTNIGASAFAGCYSLQSITIPFVGKTKDGTSNTHFGYIFGATGYSENRTYAPVALTEVIITGGTSIGNGAFKDCVNLQSITIPDSVTSIGEIAFYGCGSLQNIAIGNSVTNIGDSAFYECNSLRSIAIPDSVTSLGFGAFYRCNGSLESITVAEGNTKYHSAGNCLIETATKTLILGCKNSVIPTDGSVTGIADDAFNGCSGLQNIAIPNSVTTIGASAFYECGNLGSVVISDGVLSIGWQAFNGCVSLQSIVIPDSVTDIGNGAFTGCNSLQSITIPFVGATKDGTSDTYFGYLFGATSSDENSTYVPAALTEVIVTGGTNIGANAFRGCGSLTSIVIPDSVTNIGDYAFSWCSSLTSIAIPNGVTSIGSQAFKGCSSLTSIVIPDSVTTIGSSAFTGCERLQSITIPFVGAEKDGTSNTHFGYIFGADSYSKNSTFVPASLTEVIVTGGTSIGADAFRGCGSIQSIAIPNSVTSIGANAFDGCGNIQSIAIPNSVTSIGAFAFSNCNSLTELKMPAEVAGFYGAANVKNVVITGGTSIKDNAFYLSGSLQSIEIPDSVTSIGVYAFIGCTGLTSIVIPDSVTSIGSGAFAGCESLQSITIPFVGATKDGTSDTHFGYIFGASDYFGNADNVPVSLKEVIITGGTSIDYAAFLSCANLTGIVIPNSVTSIGDVAFSGCSGLTGIVIPNSVTSIGSSAFLGCGSLTGIVIPDSVTNIGSAAFKACNNLQSITIPFVGAEKDGVNNTHFGYIFAANSYSDNKTFVPSSLKEVIITGGTSIDNYAFYECSSLTSISIPDSVTGIGSEAFNGCSGLESITVSEGNTKYYTAGNCLIETATKTLILGCKNSVIPTDGSVTSIGTDAFKGCSGLQSITIPDSVTSIGTDAFKGCSGLTELKMPAEVAGVYGAANVSTAVITGGTLLRDTAFQHCGSLQSVTIPNSVTSIGYSAFNGCSGLTGIVIPDSVTTIGNFAFSGCESLKSIVIPYSVTSIGYYAFQGCSGLETITVAAGNTKYHSAGNCLIETTTKTLIAGCKTSVIPTDGSVTRIEDRAFEGCSSLFGIVIPNGVKTIGFNAFSHCSSLTRIVIGNSVKNIEREAFQDCKSLTSIEYQGTKAQWKAIWKGENWKNNTGNYTVTCTDGTLMKAES